MRNLFSIISLLCICHFLSAQEGAPLLTHFRESREIEDQSWAICQDKNKVMLFAYRKGILSFDGEDWTPLRLKIIPYVMEMDPSGRFIYVGGDNDYGFLEKGDNGLYRYESLAVDSSGVGLITKISVNDNIVSFYSSKTISWHDINTWSLEKRIHSQPDFPYAGMFTLTGKAFVNVRDKGLHRMENDTLFPIVTGYLTKKSEILFAVPYTKKMALLGLSNGKLTIFDGNKYYNYPIGDSGYIAENGLSGGISIGDSLYAFSTLGGGAVIAEKLSGKVRFIINNTKGLPDDEIFAIGLDSGGGLWLSHTYGLTRADLNLPIGNFSIYPGIKGNLTTSLKYHDELFVATSEGVFYLAHEESYSEVEIVKRKTINPKIEAVAPVRKLTSTLVPAPEPRNIKKGIFSRIFGKKNEGSEPLLRDSISIISEPLVVISEMPAPAEFTIEKVRKLKSIDYVYKKIEGLNEKCRQLVTTENGILAATNRGLYTINDHKASVIAGDRYINFITWEPVGGKYAVVAQDGYFRTMFNKGKWVIEIPDKKFKYPLYSVIQTSNDILWLGGDNAAYRVELNSGSGEATYEEFRVEKDYSQRYLLGLVDDTVFLFTETSVSVFNTDENKFMQYNMALLPAQTENFRYPLSNIPIIEIGNEWIKPEREKSIGKKELRLMKLFDDILSVNCENGNIWVVDGGSNLYCINIRKASKITPATDLFIKNIRNEKGMSFDPSNIVFEGGDNVINFEIIAPAYIKKNLTQYQYFINDVMTEWSPWSTQSSYSKGIPKAGDYTLLVRARDFWGEVGEPVSIFFTIKAPFTRTTFFYLLASLAVFIIIILVVRFRERQLQEKNRLLENKVKERTAEIEAQKEEITSSIEYASRIQMAMLPVSNLFTESFSDFFIIFKPRDIVSGDFYWIGEDEESIYLTVADCTGHGVPGAFMSTLGISVLNEIISHHTDLKANMVLNFLREKIKNSLHQTGKEGEATDGMDISLCILKKDRQNVQFAGAYNPLFIVTSNNLKEYKADRMPIGIYYGHEASFTNYDIRVNKGDVLYLLSDGLTDQFGGIEGSKYKRAQLKKLLSEIHSMSMAEQKRLIETEFSRWKGRNEQVDDITIIGVRI